MAHYEKVYRESSWYLLVSHVLYSLYFLSSLLKSGLLLFSVSILPIPAKNSRPGRIHFRHEGSKTDDASDDWYISFLGASACTGQSFFAQFQMSLFSALFHYVKAKVNNGEHLAASPPSETNNQNTVSLMVLNTREGSCTLSGTGAGVYSFALDNMAQGRRMYWQIQSIICFECCMCTGKQLDPIDSWPMNVRVCNCNLQVLQGVRLVVARMCSFLCVSRRAIMQLLLQFL